MGDLELRDDGVLTTLAASTYPYGGGLPEHGVQITLRRDKHRDIANDDPYQCLRLPRAKALALARWIIDQYDPRPTITIDPQVQFGQPCIDGAPVDAVASRIRAGDTVTETADDFGLTREQVLVACWYVATDITQSLEEWHPWLEWSLNHQQEFHRGDWDNITDPPGGGQ